jgi:hypothetical protein
MATRHGGPPAPAGCLPHPRGVIVFIISALVLTPSPAAPEPANQERALNASLKVAYDREMNEFRDRQEKAAGDILAHLSRSQCTHVVDRQDDPAWMWAMLKSVHLQQVPGMHFSAYNDLFSIVKGPEETLPAVASRVEEAIARVIKLRPKQITEVSTSPGGFTQTTRNYAIGNLDNELALMAMLRALPREEYADFVSSLMRQKDLTRANVEAAFVYSEGVGLVVLEPADKSLRPVLLSRVLYVPAILMNSPPLLS